jgi:hypothetical protein
MRINRPKNREVCCMLLDLKQPEESRAAKRGAENEREMVDRPRVLRHALNAF